MTQVETVFGQQHRITGYLVVVLQHLGCHVRGAIVGRHEVVGIELILAVRSRDRRCIRRTEVVGTFCERVSEHAVAVTRPIERVGRSNAAIGPVVGVGDGDGLVGVQEAAVLSTAAKEVLGLRLGERLDGALLIKVEGRGLGDHDTVARLDAHLASRLVQNHGRLSTGDLDSVTLVDNRRARLAVGIRGVGLGLNLSRVGLATRRGILRELAFGVDIVTENAVL